MSLWIRPASILPRFVEEAMRDFRYLEPMMFGPLQRLSVPWEAAETAVVANGDVVNNDSKFAVSIDVSKFKPENLKVNIEGRQLTIEGKEEVKDENGYSMRSFVRQWMLPENVDLDAVRSSLSDNGQLSIEAPKIGKAVISGNESHSYRRDVPATESIEGEKIDAVKNNAVKTDAIKNNAEKK
ncbi:Hsp20/alpha crystallin family protein [Cooperia oncophora]